MTPGAEFMVMADPLAAAIAMQQGMTGGINSPDRLLFLAAVVLGVVALMLLVVGIQALVIRAVASDQPTVTPSTKSVFEDPWVMSMAAASITGLWIPSSVFEKPEPIEVEEEPTHRVAA